MQFPETPFSFTKECRHVGGKWHFPFWILEHPAMINPIPNGINYGPNDIEIHQQCSHNKKQRRRCWSVRP
jgi:hypothetical protein